MAVSPDGTLLASSGNDAKILIWSIEDKEIKLPIEEHTGIVWDVAFSPSGKLLASGSLDKTVKISDVNTGKLRASLEHPSNVWSVCFSPTEESLVASGCFDNKVRVWNWKTRECVQTFSIGDSAIQNIDCTGMKLSGVTGLSQFQELFLAERGALFE